MSGKIRFKKVVTHNYDKSVKHLVDRQDAFIRSSEAKTKELVERHNSMAATLQALEKVLQQIAVSAATEIGKTQGKLETITQEFDKALTGIDRNVLALAEIMKEVFGQLTQTDAFMQKIAAAIQITLGLSESDTETIKKDALEWYKDITATAFETVQYRFVEAEQARLKQETAEQTAKEEAEKAAIDVEETDRVGQEMKRAGQEDSAIFSPAGGPGATVPEGADLFGGDYAPGG